MARGTLGIIGSGNIGKAVATVAVRAGLDVVLSNSRGPASLAPLVEELGGSASAGTVVESATAGDHVLVAIPFFRFAELPVTAFDGRVVLDAMNFDPGRDGKVADLVNSSGPAHRLQQHLSGAQVVKVFSNIYASHIESLARRGDASGRTALPIAGDYAVAKASVTGLLDILGFDGVDAGDLASASAFDLGTPAFVVPYMANAEGEWWLNLQLDTGAPFGQEALKRVLGA